jgi:hypothetical protein
VRREGERLLHDLKTALDGSRNEIHTNLTNALKEYFDPNDGRFQERVERLIKQDGDLEQVLQRQVGGNGSVLANTLAEHIGENSPLMKLLNPEEANGLVSSVRTAISAVIDEEQNRILSEFSLDNDKGALKRLVNELIQANGKLKTDLANEVGAVVQEFSLDKEDSALSRLVKRVETAQETITKEFSLDEEGSALSRLSIVINEAKGSIDSNLTLDNEASALYRLKRELVEILGNQEQKVQGFQTNVLTALESMTAQRKESARSTQHGNDFEATACEVIEKEVRKAGDIPTRTGQTTGSIKNCKVGDLVVELGADGFQKFTSSIDVALAWSEYQSQSVTPTQKRTVLLRYSGILFPWGDRRVARSGSIKASALPKVVSDSSSSVHLCGPPPRPTDLRFPRSCDPRAIKSLTVCVASVVGSRSFAYRLRLTCPSRLTPNVYERSYRSSRSVPFRRYRASNRDILSAL